MENIKNIGIIISLISASITTISLIYRTGFKNNSKREREYYNKLLVPFILKYHENNNINALKFCNETIKWTDEIIPQYIKYLMFNKKKDELKIVLIVDYTNLYKNDDNTISSILKIINKSLMYTILFIALAFLIAMSYILFEYFNTLIILIKTNFIDIRFLLFFFFAIATTLLIPTGILKYIRLKNIDQYTMKISKIEEYISRKLKIYQKQNHKFFY